MGPGMVLGYSILDQSLLMGLGYFIFRLKSFHGLRLFSCHFYTLLYTESLDNRGTATDCLKKQWLVRPKHVALRKGFKYFLITFRYIFSIFYSVLGEEAQI